MVVEVAPPQTPSGLTGGECDAVARALHHEARIQSLLAVKKIVFFTTTERKLMSKMTFLKRVALTAIAALGFGLLSTAPSSALQNPNSTISGSCVYRNNAAGTGLGGFISLSYTAPNAGTGKIAVEEYSYTNDLTKYASAHTANTWTYSTAALDSNTSTIIVPIVDTWTTNAGSMTFLAWIDPTGATGTDPAATAVQTTITCSAAGAPASYSLSASASTVSAGETATFTITPKDAAGNTTILTPGTETITVTAAPSAGTANVFAGKLKSGSKSVVAGGAGLGANGTSTSSVGSASGVLQSVATANMPSASSTSSAAISLVGIHADALPTMGRSTTDSATSTGAFTVNVRNTAAATTTVTVNGPGAASASTYTLTTGAAVYGEAYGFGSGTATSTRGYGIIAGTAFSSTSTASGLVAPSAAYPLGNLAGTAASTASTTFRVSTARTTVPMTWALSTSGTFSYTVAAVTGVPLPTGITAGTYGLTPSNSETMTSATFTVTAPVAGQQFKVTWSSTDNTTVTATFVFEAPQVGTSRGTVTYTNTETSKKVAAGGSATAEVTIHDQFGSAVSGATVNFSRTGRNATLSADVVATNASGKVSHTWTDADSTKSLTTYPSDVVSVTATYGNSGSYTTAQTSTYTFVAALTAGTVTTSVGTDEIAADDSSVITVTVKDSAGVALSGYPVTLSGLSNTYVLGNSMGYTNTSGTVDITVYGRAVGTESLTFTSGGKSATASLDVIAGTSRTYSLDKTTVAMAPGENPVVTVTVKDKYGNVVEDQTVTVSYIGAGGVEKLNGVSASSATTDANGQVAITLGAGVAGTGTLTVKSTMANTSTASLNGDGTAQPARTASTGLTVAVTVSGTSAVTTAVEAAADAAAEAIDAANAATDAANLAAEAADAATVAAEEARDAADAATAAVEELATQVATLMAALKAQITTLANTVAKIAKKVKA